MRLTRGEGWWLLRRRMGLTLVQWCGPIVQMSEDRYRRWELDRELAPMPVLPGNGFEPPEQLRGALTPGEWCTLQRRRQGWTLPEAARRIGISRQTLWKAEHDQTGGVEGVRRFYERIGPARPTTAAPVQVPGPHF